MKEFYKQAELEVTRFTTDNVLTTSNEDDEYDEYETPKIP